MTAPRFQGDPPTHFVSPLLEERGPAASLHHAQFPGRDRLQGPVPASRPRRPAACSPSAASLRRPRPSSSRSTAPMSSARREGGCAGNADALMTDRPGLPIAVFSADCVPLLIYDPDGRRLAVVARGLARHRPVGGAGGRRGAGGSGRPARGASWRPSDRPSARAATRWTSR